MPQYVGSVYLDVRYDATKASRDLSTQLGAAGAAGGEAATRALSDRMLAFGTQATRVGRQLSFGLSAPIAALGHASETAFLAFDTNMTKVAALTGTGAQQTGEWTQEVLDLASSYGIAGDDAAQALYLITSSGIKGESAMKTLDVTLKSSAVGLGNAATMAGLLTSAMNAYGEATLPASKAADILTGAVQESKVPADELAGSISQLLPFGAKLGVSFDQITGAMAGLSLQGTNASMAATQLRGIFNAMLDPSAQANKALAKIGLTSEQLRATLTEQGILPMLHQLQEGITASGGEADSQLAEMFGNVRALTGVFGLLNDEGGKIDRVFENTSNSAGKLDAAFRITADSGAFKARQASEGMHNELVKLGADVAPVVVIFTQLAKAGLGVFNMLGPFKPLLVFLGAGLAILGPVAYSIGAIADVASLATKALVKMGLVTEGAASGEVAATEANAAAMTGLTGAIAGATDAMATLGTASTEALGSMGASAEVAGAAVEQSTLFSAATMDALVVSTEGEAAALGQLAMFGPVAMTGIEASTGIAAAEMGTLVVETEGETVALGETAAAGGLLMTTLLPLAVVAAAIGASIIIWSKRMEVAQENADALGDVFANKVAGEGIQAANETIGKTVEQIANLRNEAEQTKAPWDSDYREELYKGARALEDHVRATQADIGLSRTLANATGENADKIFQWLSNQRNANKTFDDAGSALQAYTQAMAEHSQVVSTAATTTGRLVEQASLLSDKFFGVQNAENAYADALTHISDAERAAADSQRAIGDARRDERDAIDKVSEAHRKYSDSLARIRDAQEALVEAQHKLNDEMRGITPDESLDIRQAQLGVRRAQKRRGEGGKDPLDRQQAQIDVQRARMDLTKAQGAHAKNLADAQKDVDSAQKSVADAQEESRNALKGITDAQRGVEDAHRKVADAERDATKAQKDVTKAQEDAVGAAITLDRKQSDWATTVKEANGDLSILTRYLDDLKDRHPELAGPIGESLGKVGDLQTWLDAQAPAAEDAGKKTGELFANAVNEGVGNALPPSEDSPWYTGVTGFFNSVGTTIAEDATDWKDNALGWIDTAKAEAGEKLGGLVDEFETGLGGIGGSISSSATDWKDNVLGWIDTAKSEGPAKLAELPGAFASGLGVITGTIARESVTWFDSAVGWVDRAKTDVPDKINELNDNFSVGLSLVGETIGSVVAPWKDNVLGWVETAKTEGPQRLSELKDEFATGLGVVGTTIAETASGWKDNVLGWIGTAKDEGPAKLGELTTTFTTWAAGVPGAVKDAFGDVTRTLYYAGRSMIGGFFDAIKEVIAALPGFFGPLKDRFVESFTQAFAQTEQRAQGGPLAPGQLSTVNELGAPELWTAGGKQYLLPVAPGHVTPLHPVIDRSVTNQPTLNVGDIKVYGADSPVQTAYEVRRQLRSKTRMKARL